MMTLAVFNELYTTLLKFKRTEEDIKALQNSMGCTKAMALQESASLGWVLNRQCGSTTFNMHVLIADESSVMLVSNRHFREVIVMNFEKYAKKYGIVVPSKIRNRIVTVAEFMDCDLTDVSTVILDGHRWIFNKMKPTDYYRKLANASDKYIHTYLF